MARIAVGGVQHETNVFAPYQAGYEVFERHDEWPPLSRGLQMLDNVHGVHLPITGAIERLEALGHEIVPLAVVFGDTIRPCNRGVHTSA